MKFSNKFHIEHFDSNFKKGGRLTAVSPDFHRAIIRPRDNQFRRRMKRGPIDSTIVSLQDKLHHDIRLPEQLRLARRPHAVHPAGARGDILLAQPGNVPHANRLIEGRGDDQVLRQMELRAHDVVIVAGEDVDAVAGLPVPDAHRLVVRAADDPRVFVVEKGGADVVEMAEQCENAAPEFVIPNLREKK